MKRVEIVTPLGEVLAAGHRDENWTKGWIMVRGHGFDKETLEVCGLTIREVPEPVEFEEVVGRVYDHGAIANSALLPFTGRKVRVRVEVVE